MTATAERAPAAAPTPPAALARPPAGDLLLMGVALSAVSTSGPLIAACAAPSLAIAMWRNGIASGLLLPVALLRSRAELRSVLSRPARPALLAGLLLALHFATWIPSVAFTSVASATALVATQPAWAAVLARVGGERIPRAAWAGIGLAVVGAALVTGVDVSLSARAVVGDLLAVVGGGFAAAYMATGSVARRVLSTTAYTTVCYSTCALLLLVVCLGAGLPLGGYAGRDWLLLVGLTLGPQLLGHSVFNRVLRTTSPTVVSLSILLEVPGAALLALAWLGQRPSLLAVPGLVLLVCGVAVVVRAGARSTARVIAETD